ncbi:two-component system sensor histidine kinase CreC [Methylibium sp.]|uniref:two-component system sensor histidine kinase CreC n=1 Tax=Methylibium sp. TaxID=2067992 RepID=UPI003D0AC82B
MTKRNRIFIGILLAYALGVVLLLWRLVGDIDPRYRESAEESLVETAHLMASWIESRSSEEGLAIDALRPVFRALYAREFKADIFGFEKTRVELRATVVDREGRVLFDSMGRYEGADHSQWRDVRLALAGEYGARTSADVDGDPHTSVMYVAAPIVIGGEIVGAVSVGKPVQSFGQFVEKARRRTLLVGATSVAAVLLLVLIVSVWLVRPFGLVSDLWRYVRTQRSLSLRRLGRRTLGALGAAFDEMRDALAGRNYVADYVQTLTHELKSPLSAIRGAAELLNDEPAMPEADRQRFLGNIQRETLRIQELVDRMMELAALESRRQIEHPEAVALRPLLDELAASAQPVAAARRIEVVVLPVSGDGDETEAVVEGDALLLRRAIGNLLDNAIDFSPTGGRVTLQLATHGQRGGSVDIIVRDQGPGIPDYADDKVFERFYSLARPHSQKKSTGLGLAFVKEIAELHRGRVSLRNAGGGVGAVATLGLPRAVGSGRSVEADT